MKTDTVLHDSMFSSTTNFSHLTYEWDQLGLSESVRSTMVFHKNISVCAQQELTCRGLMWKGKLSVQERCENPPINDQFTTYSRKPRMLSFTVNTNRMFLP